MKKRQLLGVLALLAGLSGYWSVSINDSGPASPTIYSTGVLTVLNWMSWIWLVLAVAGLLSMIFGWKNNSFNIGATVLYAVMFCAAITDVVMMNNPPSPSVDVLHGFLLPAMLFLGVPVVNCIDCFWRPWLSLPADDMQPLS